MSPVRVPDTRAGSGALHQGGGVLDGLGTWSVSAFEALASRESLRAQSSWEAAKCVVGEGLRWGRRGLTLDPPLPTSLRGLRGLAGGMSVGSSRTDTCCVTKLWHLISAYREVHEKHVRFYLAF